MGKNDLQGNCFIISEILLETNFGDFLMVNSHCLWNPLFGRDKPGNIACPIDIHEFVSSLQWLQLRVKQKRGRSQINVGVSWEGGTTTKYISSRRRNIIIRTKLWGTFPLLQIFQKSIDELFTESRVGSKYINFWMEKLEKRDNYWKDKPRKANQLFMWDKVSFNLL